MQAKQKPALQFRWQLEEINGEAVLMYFGLRNPPKHLASVIKISPAMAALMPLLDGTRELGSFALPSEVQDEIEKLSRDGILVEAHRRRLPATRGRVQSCRLCVNNDLVLPGLEFDDSGLCAFCQCYEDAQAAGLKSGTGDEISPAELQATAASNHGSRYDVMAFCTGGKDSTFLLWYLAEKLKLRVLAVSWDMPYTNHTCRDNLRRAVERLPTVELVERRLPWERIKKAMRGQFALNGLPCLCPTVAHVIFYPLAVAEKIPFIMQGVEDVQLAAMNYVLKEIKNGNSDITPQLDNRSRTLNFLKFICKPQLDSDPFSFAYTFQAIQQGIRQGLGNYYGQLEDIIPQAQSDPGYKIPELRRLQTEDAYRTWREVATNMEDLMGWQRPPGQKGLLHTSCRIEKVKDFCQQMRFKNMRSRFFPQSIVELSAAVFFGLLERQEARLELKELGYNQAPSALAPLLADLDIKEPATADSDNEFFFSLKTLLDE